MGSEGVELLLGRVRMESAVTETDAQSEVGAVGTGEQPSVAGEASSGMSFHNAITGRATSAGSSRARRSPTAPDRDRRGPRCAQSCWSRHLLR